MGRHTSHEYQVKNTFVEIQIPPEEQQFSRSQRALTEGEAGQGDQVPSEDGLKGRLAEYLAARTPSPFMHPAQDPTALPYGLAQLPGCGYDAVGGNMPIAFGDLPPDFELSGFEGLDGQGNYSAAMPYDPATGMFMPYDWSMQFNPDCYPMMGGVPVEGGIDEFGNCLSMMPNGGVGHTEQLLAALSEKLAAGRDNGMGQPGLSYECPEGATVLPDGYGDAVGPSPDIMDGTLGVGGDMEAVEWNAVEMQVAQPRSDGGGGGRKRDRNRERGERGGRSGGAQELGSFQNTLSSAAAESEVSQQQGPVNFTTVMFRNIPNKYTREMLVKQLEQDLKGHFDFVYLPIDFKNQCNVGYAFINFRSIEACGIFMQNFNGVEVRKCLPGLNSRKVTEVTPARVQGFEDNVQRLRNSPVMRELAHHPEWMPLIFDENGVQVGFPSPERPLEPIKPRRRAREEVVAGAGA